MVIMKNAKSKAIKNSSIVRTWYADATFTVVGKPFYQLWTIIGHIRRSGPRRRREEKVALNLVYAIMSGKTHGLYCEVIRANLRALQEWRGGLRFAKLLN